jgi:hypothetical protein
MDTVNLTVTIDAASGGRGITLRIAPVDERERLTTECSSVLVSLWREGAAVVRGRITHTGSGSVAYFQGTDMLLRIAEELRIRLQL